MRPRINKGNTGTKLVSTSRLNCLKRYDSVLVAHVPVSKSDEVRMKLEKLFN